MIYNAGYFTFGDVDSREYNVHISGGGTFDAPERDVEFVSIDGRNGDIAQDNGRFQNVEITYPAFISRSFLENFDNFRAAMYLQTGYQRLYDSYHPLEYREAVLRMAIQPDTGAWNRSGKFDITFNCKPQRFLLSGADAVEYSLVSSGGIDAETGADFDNDFYYRVEYTPVTPGTLFEASVTYQSSVARSLLVAWYDSSKTFISAESATAAAEMSLSLVVPSNAAYVRVMYGFGTGTYIGSTGLTINNNGVETHYGDGGILLINPTGFTAQPIIHLTVSGAATLEVMNMSPTNAITTTQIAIADFSSTGFSSVAIDSNIGDSYSEDALFQPTSLNSYVTITSGGNLTDYPTLKAGRTFISTPSTVTKISVQAGWWTV